MLFGRGDSAGWAEMLEDLADLFEQSAANATPIREIFGDDPTEFVETFVQKLPGGAVGHRGAGTAEKRHGACRRRRHQEQRESHLMTMFISKFIQR